LASSIKRRCPCQTAADLPISSLTADAGRCVDIWRPLSAKALDRSEKLKQMDHFFGKSSRMIDSPLAVARGAGRNACP
jgi:hypothetical protein